MRTIIYAGLLTGTLDILAACIQYYLSTRRDPAMVMRFIASGVFGDRAYSPGAAVLPPIPAVRTDPAAGHRACGHLWRVHVVRHAVPCHAGFQYSSCCSTHRRRCRNGHTDPYRLHRHPAVHYRTAVIWKINHKH